LADLNHHCQPFDSATILVRIELEFNPTDKKKKKSLLSQPRQRRVQEIVLPVVICPILNPSWLATNHAQLRRLHPNFICCFMEDIDLGEGDNEGNGQRREGDDRVRKVLTTT